jgi:hypothetical protein
MPIASTTVLMRRSNVFSELYTDCFQFPRFLRGYWLGSTNPDVKVSARQFDKFVFWLSGLCCIGRHAIRKLEPNESWAIQLILPATKVLSPFTVKETGDQSLSDFSEITINKWQIWDSNPGLSVPNPTLKPFMCKFAIIGQYGKQEDWTRMWLPSQKPLAFNIINIRILERYT